MIVVGVLTLLLAGVQAPAGDTTALRAPLADSLFIVSARRPALDSAGRFARLDVLADEDTVRRRRRAVEVSEWYSRRLTVHRYVAYATIPVFALQYAAGNELFTKGAGAPTWAKTMHRVGATMLAGMFTVNTVTGAWNWWDSRSAPQGRIFRTVHALTMIGTDFAFSYTGAKLSKEAENSDEKRKLHHKVAMWSIGVSVASETAMKLFNRSR
jgi:hypothetical protein